MPNLSRGLAAAAAVLISQIAALPVHAHHPTGGITPASFLHGLLSGIGHPILGLDHMAYVVGIGLLAAVAGFGLLLPALFVAAMTAGLGLHVSGVDIPRAELWLAASVVLIGVAVLRPRDGEGRWLEGGLFAVAGLLHGYAFAETVIGAEPTPMLAYIVGLAATQMAIATIAYAVARGEGARQPLLATTAVRTLGVVIGAVGVGFAIANGVTV